MIHLGKRWAVLLCAAIAAFSAFGQGALNPESRIVLRDPANLLGGGTLVVLKPSANVSFGTFTQQGLDKTLGRIHIVAEDTKLPSKQPQHPDYEMFFTKATGLGVGSVPANVPRNPPDLAKFAIHANNLACNALGGSVTAIEDLKAVFHEDIQTWQVLRVKGKFKYNCGTNVGDQGVISGDFFYEVEGAGDGGGDTGGGDDGGDEGDPEEPPPPPPPTFHVNLLGNLGIDPLVSGNASSRTVGFNVAVDEGFASDIHLGISSNAPENSGFEVEISPATIAAPGNGAGTITIRTGAMTRPSTYDVTVFATAGEIVSSQTFQVTIECTPPFILAHHQPVGVTAQNGTQVQLEVTPSGTGPFFYQWFKGERGQTREPVLSAHESKLIFTTRITSPYWVRISNACGIVDSNSAIVETVGELPGPVKKRSRH